jgi:hypothetical protein
MSVAIRRSLVIAVVGALAGIGCGGDDSSDSSDPIRNEPPASAPAGSDAAEAREAGIAYFLSKDPAACTEDVTEKHIKADYGGDLEQCEAVRRNNNLVRSDFTVAGEADVTGDARATLRGQVLITGETFVLELEKVDGEWKVDRIRDSQ